MTDKSKINRFQYNKPFDKMMSDRKFSLEIKIRLDTFEMIYLEPQQMKESIQANSRMILK